MAERANRSPARSCRPVAPYPRVSADPSRRVPTGPSPRVLRPPAGRRDGGVAVTGGPGPRSRSGDPISRELARLLETAAADTGGQLCTSIPELANVEPDRFGIAVASVAGRRYRAGDADVAFTLQSVSKPFVFALAVADLGLDTVARHVGFEPSGEPFNAISLEPGTGRPSNPMINAGAIVTSALVTGAHPDERFERILSCLSAFAGRELDVDEAVFRSELATGDRNRALSYLTRAAGVQDRDVHDATVVYFRQCAVRATAEDLATMAATLAAGGRNPLTGERVVPGQVATATMSVMAAAGMYDASGAWLLRVGLPAKSGVSGAIAATQPGQFGIGVYAPRVDVHGHSVRGRRALALLSGEYGLHLLRQPGAARSPVARSVRTGPNRYTIELHGALDFIAVEQVVVDLRAAAAATVGPSPRLYLDVERVTGVHPAAQRLLAAALIDLRADGQHVTISDASLLSDAAGR